MKLKRFLIFLLFLLLCAVLFLSFIFSSCKKEKEADTTQAGTLAGETSSTAQIPLTSTLDQMIGEMIILCFRGTEVSDSSKIVKDINKYYIGGVILFDYDVPSKSFPRNIVDPKQTKKLIEDIKNLICFSSIKRSAVIDRFF